MGQTVTKQDIQNLLAIERNRILERTITKQDLNALTEAIRNIIVLHQQSQQMLKQSEYQRLQLTRRAVAVEARLAGVENELHATQTLVARMLDRLAAQRLQPQVVQPAQTERGQTPTTEYVYRPQ